MRKLKTVAGTGLALVLLAGCGEAGSGAQQQHKTLTVLAAASLTESFDQLGQQFHAQHPDVDVKFDYEGSSTLAEQIKQGRPADVFASADDKNMSKVAGQVSAPQTFAVNRLVIVVPPGNPAHVNSLADFANAKRAVVCAPQVPCGTASQKAAEVAHLQLHPVSEENDVKAVLNKVAAGEADAGLVYVSDAKSAGNKVQTVDFPESQQVANSYPIATINNAPDAADAKAFVDFVRGDTGRQVLTAHGFTVP